MKVPSVVSDVASAAASAAGIDIEGKLDEIARKIESIFTENVVQDELNGTIGIIEKSLLDHLQYLEQTIKDLEQKLTDEETPTENCHPDPGQNEDLPDEATSSPDDFTTDDVFRSTAWEIGQTSVVALFMFSIIIYLVKSHQWWRHQLQEKINDQSEMMKLMNQS